jgi:phosphatidylserine/phosphatidylglycerophosphate/cardiolipin synthase-like enzyme
MRGRVLSLLACFAFACGPKAPPVAPAAEAPVAAADVAPPPAPSGPPQLLLGETFPVETTLDDPEVGDARDLWRELIQGSKTSIDIAEFYVSPSPDGGGRLAPVLTDIRAAAGRGVSVRILADAKFARTYPDTLNALGAVENIELLLYDMKPVRGGVLHAKYFVVDRDVAWLGSQNMDWRSVEHIHELGVAVREPAAVAGLAATFDLDWGIAGGEVDGTVKREAAPATRESRAPSIPYGDGEVTVKAVASPGDLLPDGVQWDLPEILRLIRTAQTRVRVQLLNYAVVGYDKTEWRELDDALREAAGRGVAVELMVSNWSKKGSKLREIQSLARVEGIEAKFVNVPEWSGGFIDFARTIHSKYMTVDGRGAWIGTSNWSRDYFHSSRNVGLIVSGAPFVTDLDRVFDRIWTSEYAEVVDPDGTYKAPRLR